MQTRTEHRARLFLFHSLTVFSTLVYYETVLFMNPIPWGKAV